MQINNNINNNVVYVFLAPQSQFGEGARSHCCMDEWNRPTPVRRRLILTQAVRGKLNPTGLVLVMRKKPWNIDVYQRYTLCMSLMQTYSHSTPCSICDSFTEKRGCLVPQILRSWHKQASRS